MVLALKPIKERGIERSLMGSEPCILLTPDQTELASLPFLLEHPFWSLGQAEILLNRASGVTKTLWDRENSFLALKEIDGRADSPKPIFFERPSIVAFDAFKIPLYREDFLSKTNPLLLPDLSLSAISATRGIDLVFWEDSDSAERAPAQSVTEEWPENSELLLLRESLVNAVLTSDPDTKNSQLVARQTHGQPSPSARYGQFLAVRRAYVSDFTVRMRNADKLLSSRKASKLRPRSVEPAVTSFPRTDNDEHIYVGIASYPGRRNALKAVIESILPQVTKIFVFLNEYQEPPDFCDHDKIQFVLSSDLYDTKAAGKAFLNGRSLRGYIFLLDDDNLVSPGYIQHMISGIEFYKRRAVMCLHGSVYFRSPWYYLRACVTPYQRANNRDMFVNLPGSGTVAFHSDTLRFDFFKFFPVCDG